MPTHRPLARWAHPVALDERYWELRKEASLKKEAVDWTSLQMMADQAQPMVEHALGQVQHGYHAIEPVLRRIPMANMVPEVAHLATPWAERVGAAARAGNYLSAAGNVAGGIGDVAWGMALPKLTVLGAMGSVMHPEGKAGLTAKLFKPYSKAYWNGLSRWEKATQIVGAPALAPFHLTGNVLEAAGKVQTKNALSMLNAGLVHGIEGTTGKRRWLENRIRRPLNIGGDYAYEAGVDFGKRMRNNNILSIKELTPAHYQQALQSAGDAFQARSGAVGALANRFGIAPNFTSTTGHVLQELATDDPLTRMGRVFTRPEGMGMVEAYRKSPFTSGTTTRIGSPVSAGTIRQIAAPINPAARALPFKQRLGIARKAVFTPPPGAANVGTRLGRSLRLLTHL